ELATVTEAPPSSPETLILDSAQPGSKLFNLGRAPHIVAYAIRGGNLTVCDYLRNDCGLAADKDNAAVWVPIGANIASLKARYGRDTSAARDGTVDVFDQETPAFQQDWLRVRALRLALVARSAQYESHIVAGRRACREVTP